MWTHLGASHPHNKSALTVMGSGARKYLLVDDAIPPLQEIVLIVISGSVSVSWCTEGFWEDHNGIHGGAGIIGS